MLDLGLITLFSAILSNPIQKERNLYLTEIYSLPAKKTDERKDYVLTFDITSETLLASKKLETNKTNTSGLIEISYKIERSQIGESVENLVFYVFLKPIFRALIWSQAP